MHQSIPRSNHQELLLLLLGQRKRLRVTGLSMLPNLKPGDEILYNPRAYAKATPQINDIIVAKHPFQNHLKIVKRIAEIHNAQLCYLLGDNLEYSTDSRHWGAINPTLILGKVTSNFC